jgi:hypothetical protein
MIRNTLFAAVAALALSSAALIPGAAVAQTLPQHAPLTQADVGAFIRDADGTAIGSLKALNGNQAVVWLGFFNTEGNHLITVPSSEISAQGGRLVLNDVPATTVASGW